jgi:hypothetical protein
VCTIVLIKDQNGPYVASTIFPTYHFNIYPILIQIPCTLYNKPYITSTFFLIFILKKYFPPYILTHVTSKTNAQCLPRDLSSAHNLKKKKQRNQKTNLVYSRIVDVNIELQERHENQNHEARDEHLHRIGHTLRRDSNPMMSKP